MASTFKFLDRKSSEDETSVNDRAQLIMQLAQQQMRQQRNNQRAFALLLEKAAPSQRTTGGTDAMGKDKKAVQEPVKAKREQGQWDLDVIQEFVINDMQWGQPSNRQKKQMGRKVKAMELSIEDLILPPVPANDSSETYAELLETQELGLLRDDRAKDIESQLGKDGIVAAFKKYSDENGLQTNWDFVRMVLDDVQTICLNLKFAHNRVRPSTLAQHLEIVLSPHGDHHSPSYPSFHSTAGRVLAEVISGAYAGHREKLMRIGDTIGMNRVIGGYHFLTDHQVGQSLGSQLVLKIPQNLSINPVYETEQMVDGRTAEAVAANFMDALEQRHRTMAVNKEENAEDNYVEGIRAAMATHSRETSHMTDILKAKGDLPKVTPKFPIAMFYPYGVDSQGVDRPAKNDKLAATGGTYNAILAGERTSTTRPTFKGVDIGTVLAVKDPKNKGKTIHIRITDLRTTNKITPADFSKYEGYAESVHAMYNDPKNTTYKFEVIKDDNYYEAVKTFNASPEGKKYASVSGNGPVGTSDIARSSATDPENTTYTSTNSEQESNDIPDLPDDGKKHMFVFGSNLEGVNGKGAAEYAQTFGAAHFGVEGDEENRVEGNTYSLPTKKKPNNQQGSFMTLEDVKPHIEEFIKYTVDNPDTVFHIANLGLENGRLPAAGVGKLFRDAMWAFGQSTSMNFDEELGKAVFGPNYKHSAQKYKMPSKFEITDADAKKASGRKKKRLLITGGRDNEDYDVIFDAIKENNPSVVIHGGAKGADRLAAKAARVLGIAQEVYIPDWEGQGKSAGFKRNSQMLEEGKPTSVIAFRGGNGTADMVKKAEKAGFEVQKPQDRTYNREIPEDYKKPKEETGLKKPVIPDGGSTGGSQDDKYRDIEEDYMNVAVEAENEAEPEERNRNQPYLPETDEMGVPVERKYPDEPEGDSSVPNVPERTSASPQDRYNKDVKNLEDQIATLEDAIAKNGDKKLSRKNPLTGKDEDIVAIAMKDLEGLKSELQNLKAQGAPVEEEPAPEREPFTNEFGDIMNPYPQPQPDQLEEKPDLRDPSIDRSKSPLQRRQELLPPPGKSTMSEKSKKKAERKLKAEVEIDERTFTPEDLLPMVDGNGEPYETSKGYLGVTNDMDIDASSGGDREFEADKGRKAVQDWLNSLPSEKIVRGELLEPFYHKYGKENKDKLYDLREFLERFVFEWMAPEPATGRSGFLSQFIEFKTVNGLDDLIELLDFLKDFSPALADNYRLRSDESEGGVYHSLGQAERRQRNLEEEYGTSPGQRELDVESSNQEFSDSGEEALGEALLTPSDKEMISQVQSQNHMENFDSDPFLRYLDLYNGWTQASVSERIERSAIWRQRRQPLIEQFTPERRERFMRDSGLVYDEERDIFEPGEATDPTKNNAAHFDMDFTALYHGLGMRNYGQGDLQKFLMEPGSLDKLLDDPQSIVRSDWINPVLRTRIDELKKFRDGLSDASKYTAKVRDLKKQILILETSTLPDGAEQRATTKKRLLAYKTELTELRSEGAPQDDRGMWNSLVNNTDPKFKNRGAEFVKQALLHHEGGFAAMVRVFHGYDNLRDRFNPFTRPKGGDELMADAKAVQEERLRRMPYDGVGEPTIDQNKTGKQLQEEMFDLLQSITGRESASKFGGSNPNRLLENTDFRTQAASLRSKFKRLRDVINERSENDPNGRGSPEETDKDLRALHLWANTDLRKLFHTLQLDNTTPQGLENFDFSNIPAPYQLFPDKRAAEDFGKSFETASYGARVAMSENISSGRVLDADKFMQSVRNKHSAELDGQRLDEQRRHAETEGARHGIYVVPKDDPELIEYVSNVEHTSTEQQTYNEAIEELQNKITTLSGGLREIEDGEVEAPNGEMVERAKTDLAFHREDMKTLMAKAKEEGLDTTIMETSSISLEQELIDALNEAHYEMGDVFASAQKAPVFSYIKDDEVVINSAVKFSPKFKDVKTNSRNELVKIVNGLSGDERDSFISKFMDVLEGDKMPRFLAIHEMGLAEPQEGGTTRTNAHPQGQITGIHVIGTSMPVGSAKGKSYNREHNQSLMSKILGKTTKTEATEGHWKRFNAYRDKFDRGDAYGLDEDRRRAVSQGVSNSIANHAVSKEEGWDAIAPEVRRTLEAIHTDEGLNGHHMEDWLSQTIGEGDEQRPRFAGDGSISPEMQVMNKFLDQEHAKLKKQKAYNNTTDGGKPVEPKLPDDLPSQAPPAESAPTIGDTDLGNS